MELGSDLRDRFSKVLMLIFLLNSSFSAELWKSSFSLLVSSRLVGFLHMISYIAALVAYRD